MVQHKNKHVISNKIRNLILILYKYFQHSFQYTFGKPYQLIWKYSDYCQSLMTYTIKTCAGTAWVQMCNTRDSVALNVDGRSPPAWAHGKRNDAACSRTEHDTRHRFATAPVLAPHRLTLLRGRARPPRPFQMDFTIPRAFRTIPKLKTPVFQTIPILLN